MLSRFSKANLRAKSILGTALVGTAILGFAFPHVSNAEVDTRNGNLFMSYVDLRYEGGFDPVMRRVNNSKSPYKGIFGFGWGNEYETYLKIESDASVTVHEFGSGAANRFVPVGFSQADLKKAVDNLGELARKSGFAGSEDQLKRYKLKLTVNAEFRSSQWELFVKQKKAQPRKLTVGAQLKSTLYSYQYITKVADGYVRKTDTGLTQFFNEQGKLVKFLDKNKNTIDFSYGKDGNLAKIVDNFNRKMFFTFNLQAFVEKIEGENNKVATYKYNRAGELVESKDVDGHVYTYAYDTQGKHNLVKVGYSDGTSMKVEYWGKEKFENVKSVTDRDGTLTQYDYATLPGTPPGRKVTTKILSQGKVVSTSAFEYYTKPGASGEEWTQRLVAVVDGERTDTVYDEKCALPSSITKGKESTRFAYDVKCHLTEKTTPTEITKLQYDPKAGKVSYVDLFAVAGGKPKLTSWSKFKYYDDTANLEIAENSSKKKVTLLYDAAGRIRVMVDQDGRKISFKYNEASKPIEITDAKAGTINVEYTNSGEIKNVDSKAGRAVASQVTTSFQNLLDIIRPAGVTLAF